MAKSQIEKKHAAPAIEQVAETPVELEAPVEVETLETQFANISLVIKGLKASIASLEHAQRVLKATVKSELKNKKRVKRARKESTNKSSFKPIQVSQELAKFLGVERGTVMERPEATKRIFEYVKTHQCYGKSGPKTIMEPDSKLTKLLGPFNLPLRPNQTELGNGLSIYNMQKYLKKHLNPVEA